MMTDFELIQKILKGNQQAISLFYRRFQPKLQAYIEKKVDGQVVEEILQDTFLSALQSLPLYRGESSLYVWLLSICRHEICDYYRKQKIKEIVFSRLPFLRKIVSQALSPETALEEKELKQKIKKTFSRLSEGYRRILRLKYVDGFSVTEVATRLKISYKSAESRLSRARLAFKKEFAGQGQNGYQIGHFIDSP